MSEIWNKVELLKFSSEEFGVIYRNPETGCWEQTHPIDGERNLNVLTLREAMEKGVLPYKKKKAPKPRAKKPKKVTKDRAVKKVSSKRTAKKIAKTILKGKKHVRQKQNV